MNEQELLSKLTLFKAEIELASLDYADASYLMVLLHHVGNYTRLINSLGLSPRLKQALLAVVNSPASVLTHDVEQVASWVISWLHGTFSEDYWLWASRIVEEFDVPATLCSVNISVRVKSNDP